MSYKFIKRVLNAVVVGITATLLSACGGSDTAGENLSTYVSGGTEFAPAAMSLEQGNKVVENSYYNYFSYEVVDGEKLMLESILKKGITDFQREDCQESGDTFIVVYDTEMVPQGLHRTCTSIMSLEFNTSGKYIFQIKYPGNIGHFNASSES